MATPRCPECGRPATIEQSDGRRCVDHATDKAALHARLRALESATLSRTPTKRDRALAEMDAIERRLSEPNRHGT